MSQAIARSAARGVSRKPSSRMNRRFVSVVPSQPKRTRMSAVVLAFIVALIVVIVLPLIINTQLAMLSYQIHDSQVLIAQLKEDNQQLQSQLNYKRSAESLRESAQRYGLVPAADTGYVTLETNTISGGVPAPAPIEPETKEKKESEANTADNADAKPEAGAESGPDASQ